MSAPAPSTLRFFHRAILVCGLVAVVAASWAYLWWMSRPMLPAMTMPMPGAHHAAAPVAIMWVVMMGAMMLPTAAPMVLIHARFAAGRYPGARVAVHPILFASGYVLVWAAFGLVAAAAQLALTRAAALDPMAGKLAAPEMASAVLIIAGAFQLSPLKTACLGRCRSPIGFFMTRWREGKTGAVAMGLSHGAFCVGCCWALMLVMFVVGVMNLLWIAALSALMLIEKIAPHPRVITAATGTLTIAAGILLLVAG
ncbi:MAG TPA: DUF2182 domain-containing protein [Kofleriaceae bacterium]|nr:DUF2182 domain-containing protein [Kofleriaceae bacterium]